MSQEEVPAGEPLTRVQPGRTPQGGAEPPTRAQRPAHQGDRRSSARVAFVPAELLERYDFEEVIGTGGEATVWRAHSRDDETQTLAVKVYRPDTPFDVELRRHLSDPRFHRYVPRLYDWGVAVTADGLDVGWEAMEYFPLGSLGDLVAREAPQTRTVPPHRVRQMMSEIVDALVFWEATIRHRQTDLSPGNILVRQAEPGLELVFGDFGGVRGAGSSKLLSGVAAKLQYMSPESLAGINHPRGPYWSLGVICYHLLTAGFIYGTDLTDGAWMVSLLHDEPDVSRLPDQRWRDLVAGLLTRHSDDRWGPQEVKAWLAGSVVPVRRRLGGRQAHAPIMFAGKAFHDPVRVAAAMVDAWDEAVQWLRGTGSARLSRWLAEDAADTTFDRGLLTNSLTQAAASQAVAALAATFLRDQQPRYRGVPLTVAALTAMAGDPGRHELLREIVEHGILSYAARHACDHPDCRPDSDGPQCTVLEHAARTVSAMAAAVRADLSRVSAELPATEATRVVFGAEPQLPDRQAIGEINAGAMLLAVQPDTAESWRRTVRWQRGPAQPWWRSRRRAALQPASEGPREHAALLAAYVLVPYARRYGKAAAAVHRAELGVPLARARQRLAHRFGDVLDRYGRRAGRRTAPWLLVAAAAAVEAASLAPALWRWSPPHSETASAAVTAADFLARHTPSTIRHGIDPLQMWISALIAPPDRWIAITSIALLVVVCFAFLRRRGQATERRAVLMRLAVALFGRLVLVLYLLHLVTAQFTPLLAASHTMGPLALIAVIGTAAMAIRMTRGMRPYAMPERRGLTDRTFALAVLAATVLALQSVPMPPLRAVVVHDAPAGATGHAALVTSTHATFATATAEAIEVVAYAVPSGEGQWVRRLPFAGSGDTVTLRSTTQTLIVYASGDGGAAASYVLSPSDGRVLWQRDAGDVHGWGELVLHAEPAVGRLTALDQIAGTRRWSVTLPKDFTVIRPETDPTAGAAVAEFAVATPDNAVRVLRASDGATLSKRTMPGSGRAVLGYGQLLWIGTGADYRLTAFPSGSGAAKWTFAAPSGAAQASAWACHHQTWCVSDSLGTSLLDAGSGREQRRVGVRAQHAFATYSVLVLRGDDGSTVLTGSGETVAALPKEHAFPLAGGRLLLIPTDRLPTDGGAGDHVLALFDLDSRRRIPLGRVEINPTDCDWTWYLLACAGSTLRVWMW